jgi:hypothetical protein
LILVSVVLGLSGGRLVARDELGPAPRVKLWVEDLASLASEGRDPFRFVLLADFPLARRSNTLELALPFRAEVEAVLGLCLEFESLSIIEFFRVTGFFKSLRECPGLMLPVVASSSGWSTLMMGTEVTYLPSTSSES